MDNEMELSNEEHYIQCYENESIEKNTILAVSNYGGELTGNILSMLIELQKDKYNDYKVYFGCRKELWKKTKLLFSNYQIKNVTLVKYGEKKYGSACISTVFVY